jgi:hypothetical protein
MGDSGRSRKKRCPECRELFWPNPRVGDRQKSCGKAICQQKRHKNNCREWRRNNPAYERANRWSARIEAAKQGAAKLQNEDNVESIRALPWDLVRDEIGPEATVIVQEIVKFVLRTKRDEIRAQVPDLYCEVSILAIQAPRDENANRGPPA